MNDFEAMVVDEITLNTSNTEEIIPKSPQEVAEQKKENGNQLYKIKQYRSALQFYTEAIELCPDSSAYYGNRAACYMMLNRYLDALEDARRAVALDPNLVKGYVRIAKCGIALGDVTTAEQALIKIKNFDNVNTTIAGELHSLEILKQYERDGDIAYDKKDFRKVVYCMDTCLHQSPNCSRYKIRKAECLAFLGRYAEAQEIVNGILHFDKGNADAIYVRGVCLFYEEQIDKAFSHFQLVLRLAPDHKKAMDIYKRAKLLKQKKEEGNEAFKNRRYKDAYKLYSEALAIDPLNVKTNSKLYFNKACASLNLNEHKEAAEYCTEALKLEPNYLKALHLRAKCNMNLSQYEEAVQDYEKICKMEKSIENKKFLQEAKQALKRSKRKDLYKILGLEKNATDHDIRKAYRKHVMVFHPDRHPNASDVEKMELETKFKEVGEAYAILSDPKKKRKYDNDQDVADYEGGAHDIDPSQVFHAFFEGGQGPEFNFQSGGFPGGFTFQFG